MGALGPVFSWSATPPPYGLKAVRVPDVEVGTLLAEAQGTLGSGLGSTWDGSVLSFVSRPAGEQGSARVGNAEDLVQALIEARRTGLASLHVTTTGVDARKPADLLDDPSLAPRLATRPLDVAGGESLDVDLVLAGRGVVRAGRVADLQAFADRVGIGVLNTYTAKGVFRWDSPYHFGTGCLQERDLALAGVGPGARVLVVGVDADECTPALLDAAGVDASSLSGIDVSELSLADVRSAAGAELKPPPLYYAIFDIAQPLYKMTDSPLNPARAAADIAEVLPDGSAVCVEPGLPGLWVGRTLPTRHLGSARVPAAGRPGTAVAGALLGALEGAPRVAVVADVPGEDDERLLEWARSAGLSVTVIVWTLDAPARDAEEHRTALASALGTPGVTVLPVAVDLSATQLLIDAAGPLVAW